MNNSVLALVDGEPWPLHQPLTDSCSMTLLTFKDSDPTLANQVLTVTPTYLPTAALRPQRFMKRDIHRVLLFPFRPTGVPAPPCSVRCCRLRSRTTIPWSCSAHLRCQVRGAPFFCLQICQSAFSLRLSCVFPAVTSGAFCCDVALDPQLDSWTPSEVCLTN